MGLDSTLDLVKAECLDLIDMVGPLFPDYCGWLAFLLPAWLTGQFGFSFLWVMVGFAAYVVRKRDRLRHERRDEMHRKAAICDIKSLNDVIENPPSWIYFPKRERVDWLNKIIKQMWPYLDDYVQAFISDKTTEETIKKTIKAYNIDSFRFVTCTVGDDPPRVVNVRMQKSKEEADGRVGEIRFDLELCYTGDAQIKVSLAHSATPKITVGLKNVCFSGKMRVEMQNLTGEIPICGSVSCYFLNKPEVDFDLTNIGHVMEFSPLKNKIKSVIVDSIAAMMVLPNRYPVPLMKNVDTNLLRNPLPKGVLRIHVVDAKNLISDNYLGKYDPYVSMQVGDQKKTTSRLTNEPNPTWNQVFEFVVWSSQQILKMRVLDGDELDIFSSRDDDDSLGEYEIGVKSVREQGYLRQCVALPKLKGHHAVFNVRMLWSTFKTEPALEIGSPRYEDQTLILRLPRRSSGFDYDVAEDPLLEKASKSFLLVHLYGVDGLNLPPHVKNVKTILTVVGTDSESMMQESSVQLASTKPKWEEAFQFLADDYPDRLNLCVVVVDDDAPNDETNAQLAKWTFPLIGVMTKKDWIWKDWHEERGIRFLGPIRQRLSIRICLRLLGVEDRVFKTDDEAEDEEAEEGSRTVTPTPASLEPPSSPPENIGEEIVVLQGGENEIASTGSSKGGSDAEKSAPTVGEETSDDWRSFPHVKVEEIYGAKIQGKGDERNEGFGLIRLTVEPKEDNALRLVVHECRGLIAADEDGNTDAFVKLSIDSVSGSKKTKVVDDCLDPKFEETFTFDLKRELLELQRLNVSVKNDKAFWSREPATVGRRALDLGEYKLNQSVTRWFALKDPRGLEE